MIAVSCSVRSLRHLDGSNNVWLRLVLPAPGDVQFQPVVSPWRGDSRPGGWKFLEFFPATFGGPGFVGVVVENVDVAQDGIASAEAEFVAALLAATDPGVPENDALDALRE